MGVLAKIGGNAALLMGLAACATSPSVDVGRRGELPTTNGAQTFQLALSNVGDRQAELGAAITMQLERARLTPAASAPDLLVEAVYSRRPGVVGAYARETNGEVDWLQKPVKRRWWERSAPTLQTVVIAMRDARSGQEIYRATATQPLKGGGDLDMTGLVKAAMGDAPLQISVVSGGHVAATRSSAEAVRH